MDENELSSSSPTHPPAIHVTLEEPGAPATILKFHEPFTIGSDPDSDLAIESPKVSSAHAEVDYEDHCWWIRSVEGSKGIFLEGKRVDAVPLATGTVVTLGASGPTLSFAIDAPGEADQRARRKLRLPDPLRKVIRASTRIISVEEHKEILRRVMVRVEKLESRKYMRIIVLVSLVCIVAAGYAYYKHTQYVKLEARAEDFFYEMKDLEVSISRLEKRLPAGDTLARAEVARSWQKLKEMSASYDGYVDELGIYKEGIDPKKRAIYRVARLFGECDVKVPDEFVEEVERYIHEWTLSARLATSIERAKQRGYDDLIGRILSDLHLPDQFMYLALQESGFDSSQCGPPTRFGIAKGMWQLMPSTALRYGLRMGPLVDKPRWDPRDDRHRVLKSTLAAAHYLEDIYGTEAQASGLLVVASYNWGENVVRGLIRDLPDNPRDRNFWTFLKAYKGRIPRQTTDYVYHIFAAAVIGEDPELFGFKFEKLAGDAAM